MMSVTDFTSFVRAQLEDCNQVSEMIIARTIESIELTMFQKFDEF